MALAGSSVGPRAASLVGGVMVGSGTRTLWRLLTQKSVPMVACLASDVESRRFLVVKPSRGSEIMIFGPFYGAICRRNRKIGLGYSEFERKLLRSLCEPFANRRLWSGAPRFVATGMGIVLLRETGWVGVANEII